MLLFKEFIAVAFGGAIGSMLRFGVSRWIQSVVDDGFPWGIFTVNVLGSFVMGILTAYLLHRLQLGPLWRAAILIGVLGGFTTFSSFSMDTVTLIESGTYVMAAAYIVLTLIFCISATALGFGLVKLFE